MSDQVIDSLRELACSQIDQQDRDVRSAIDYLASLLSEVPDEATLAFDRLHYIVSLLASVEERINQERDPELLDWRCTLSRLGYAIAARLESSKARWPEAL